MNLGTLVASSLHAKECLINIEDRCVRITGKLGPGADRNPDVAQAHLAGGKSWWG